MNKRSKKKQKKSSCNKRSRKPPKQKNQIQEKVTKHKKNTNEVPTTSETKVNNQPPTRVRGRPPGKPPKLDLEQRRERHVFYEKERRSDVREGFEALRVALTEINTDMLSRQQLLAEAIKYLRQPSPEEVVDELRRRNKFLKGKRDALIEKVKKEIYSKTFTRS